MQILALHNLKGGVGKTTAAVNLACLAARAGWPTVLWDLDPQGAAGWYLGVDEVPDTRAKRLVRGKLPLPELLQATSIEGLRVIPGAAGLRHLDVWLDREDDGVRVLRRLVEPLAPACRLLVLDCPPSFSRLAEAVCGLADALLVPLVPTPLSVRAWTLMGEALARLEVSPERCFAYWSQYDARRGLQRAVVADPPIPRERLLRTAIPYAAAAERMGERRAPVCATHPSAPVSAAFAALWGEVRRRVLASTQRPA